jgi:hypothetical protein
MNGVALAIVVLLVLGVFMCGVTLDFRAEWRRLDLEWDE